MHCCCFFPPHPMRCCCSCCTPTLPATKIILLSAQGLAPIETESTSFRDEAAGISPSSSGMLEGASPTSLAAGADFADMVRQSECVPKAAV